MQGQINLLTILTDNYEKMLAFYTDVLGFAVEHDHGGYTEFVQSGVRFALCSRNIMLEATGHPSYGEERKGQAFELAFPCADTQALDAAYSEITGKGATAIKAPARMPWNQYTAFFADPDGNIHELFANL